MQLSDKQMQAEFSRYIRRETKSYSLVLLPVLLILAIISFVASYGVSN